MNLERLVMVAVVSLVLLTIALAIRGGGYGLAGLEWDNNLVITRSSVRLGNSNVLAGDRIRYLYHQGRIEVHRDADLRAALRAMETEEVYVELARSDQQVAVPLTPEILASGDLPAVLRGFFRVTEVDGREISGDMDLTAMADWMQLSGNQPSIFTVSVPEEPIVGMIRRARRASPILPLLVIVFTLGAAILALIRARSNVMTRARQHWQLLALSISSGGVLLAFMTWPDGFLADPLLLPLALLSLAIWRSLTLFAHHSMRSHWLDSTGRFIRMSTALPPFILLMASLYGWLRTLPWLWGPRRDGFVIDQLGDLVVLGAAVTVVYHLVDIALELMHQQKLAKSDRQSISPTSIATLLSTVFVVTGAIALAMDTTAFLEGGWTLHLMGLVGVQLLGDLAALPVRFEGGQISGMLGPQPDVATLLMSAADEMDLREPQLIVRFSGVQAVLSLQRAEEEQEDGRQSKPQWRLRSDELDDRLAGFLDLLDAEGGMFPRYKTIRGADVMQDDPFEGLERVVAVEFAIPLYPPTEFSSGAPMATYLVSRLPKDSELPPKQVDPEALEHWKRSFDADPRIWSVVKAATAEAALLRVGQNQHKRPIAEADHGRTVKPASQAAASALLHDARSIIERLYPIDQPGLLSPQLEKRLQISAASQKAMALVGEVGVGREFCARLIHRLAEYEGEFVLLDCSSMPEALVMAELVGEGDCPGRLKAAANGSVCVRDLSLLSEPTASAVLEAIQEHQARPILIERLGAKQNSVSLPSTIRRAVDEAVLKLRPLSERPDDLERAANFYLHRSTILLGKVITGFSADALEWLKKRHWPSNYHSLIACIRDAVILSDEETITLADLLPAVGPSTTQTPEEYENQIEEIEREAFRKALDQTGGNKSQAARLLGLKRTTFMRKLTKYSDLVD